MPPYSSDQAAAEEGELKDCARCNLRQPLDDISEVRLRVGGFAVYICKRCKKREEDAPIAFGYECPGWKYGRHGYRSARLKFRRNEPPVQTLVGQYDIIFYAADQSFGPRYHRRTKGKMSLCLREECTESGSRGRLRLCGSVSMDPTVAISGSVWIQGFSFVQSDDNGAAFTGFEDGGFLSYTGIEQGSFRGTSNSNGSDEDDSLDAELPEMYGQLRIISERSVVRYRPDAKAVNRRRNSPVIFKCIKEADKIMARHEDSITRWLSSNLGLPDFAADLICSFWCTRPSPLFYFQQGDLCLTSMMPRKGYLYDDVSTLMVARKRWSE